MTLNVVLMSRAATYLSGDFRLTYPSEGRYEDDLFAQKLVPVLKFDWCALVGFNGVARKLDGEDVGDWIAKQVKVGPRFMRERVADFLVRLHQAEEWLRPFRDQRAFSMIVTGFAGRRPFVQLISNYQDLNGRPTGRIGNLRTIPLHPRSLRAIAFPPGSATTGDETAHLEKLFKNDPRNVKSIAPAIATLNAAVHARNPYGGTVSRECVVGRLAATGEGSLQVFGIDETREYMPRYLVRAMGGIDNVVRKTDSQGRPVPLGLVQSGFRRQMLRPGQRAVMWVHEIRGIAEMRSSGTPEGWA